MAGYSNRSLAEKLGLKSGMKFMFIREPKELLSSLGVMTDEMQPARRLSGQMDYLHCFVTTVRHLESEFPRMRKALAPNGMIWISWPKKSSGIQSELTEDTIRDIGLRNALIDVKVCAIDDTWSGLKFVIPINQRH